MDETAADHRFHHHHVILQPAFQRRGAASQDRKEEGGIKVHTVIHANEGVPSDIRFTSAATNDGESDPSEIIVIYRERWEIKLLFKQMKQNFPLKYFYGESANVIKIQIWVTLIANLLLMVMQKELARSWNFSRLATMVRITLMYYVDFYSLFNQPERDWECILEAASESPHQTSLFD